MHSDFLLPAHAQRLRADLRKAVQDDLSNLAAGMQLRRFAGHRDFNPIAFAPNARAVREHMQRYRDLASQGKWAEAGRELEAIQNEVNK